MLSFTEYLANLFEEETIDDKLREWKKSSKTQILYILRNNKKVK